MLKALFSFFMLCSVLFADRDGGPYLGFGYGVSLYNDDGFFKELKEDISRSTTIYAGAYINKNLSVELVHVSFDSKGLHEGYLVKEDSNIDKNINFSVISVSTLAHYPFLNDLIDTYARFGVGEMDMLGIDSTGFTFIYGCGISVRFNEWLSMKLAYDRYGFDYDDARDLDNVIGYEMNIDYLYSAIEVQF